ncbi:serine/threonine-protein kinase 16-like [Littorina saxatilis]|uniref:non-specific serine/threonine protein kinase n=1 Tax=Littorina saxatilis TaxID=31220 RepID=A0AAN9BMN9_9CAEN
MGCMCGKEAIAVGDKRYYIRSRLGEGGFSYVDLVEETTTHKVYALKRLTCHSKEEEQVALQEVEVMKNLRHPNLVPLVAHSVLKVGHHSKTLDIVSEVFIIMPLYSRGSIQDKIESLSKRSEKMAESEIWRIFLGMCQGVSSMHNHDPPYAHRDIKPGNVMLAEDGTPVVMDLGSATKARVLPKNLREATTLQDTAAERCSMLFRAPELFTVQTNVSIDERSDIWSLGCTLYAMAYLEAPFERVYQTGGSIALAAMSGKLDFPEGAGYSTSLQDMISCLMTVEQSERPFINQVIQRVETFQHSAENRV